MYRKYILEKNWSKTTIPALSSGQTENDTPIWGRRHQLDDHNRNPNMNNRDHLVGRPTSDDGDDVDGGDDGDGDDDGGDGGDPLKGSEIKSHSYKQPQPPFTSVNI